MSAQTDNGYDSRSGPRDRRLRVGDSEREAVGEILRRQHVEGRLDTDELNERLERCLAAKTYAELDELVADLPRAEAEPRRAGWVPGRRPWPFAVLPLALIAAIVLSGGHLIWLAFPLFFLFVFRPLFWGPFGTWACGSRYTARTTTRG
jgi:Domain of unknown function (DUF1707)